MTFPPFMRPLAIVAAALCLASCGGSASFPINGTITGLTYDGLVLTSNGMDLSVKGGATAFSFPNSLSYGDVFKVTVKTPPAHQSCTTVSPLTGYETNTDTAGRTASINVTLSCYLNAYTIGGTVSGLTSAGLVLTNGSLGGTATIAADATSYTFANSVPYSVTYGVTILTQPASDVCTVSNPSGVMGDALVNNINISCVPK